MTRRWLVASAIVAGMLYLPGCEQTAQDGPPEIRLDDSICVECGMILSEERSVAATMVEGTRGPEARLFDDYNCQVFYEAAHQDQVVITRWAHDYNTSEWILCGSAWFLHSDQLRTPMASHAVAFASKEDAVNAQNELGGVVMQWSKLQEAIVNDE